MVKSLFVTMFMMAALQMGCSGCSEDKAKCKAGEQDCGCLSNERCNDGLQCVEGVCVGEAEIGFKVGNIAARACDVLMEETDSRIEVTGITLDVTVEGSFVRHAPRVAISFISKTDSAIDTGAVKVRAVNHEAGSLTVVSSTCYDKSGAALKAAEVSLKE